MEIFSICLKRIVWTRCSRVFTCVLCTGLFILVKVGKSRRTSICHSFFEVLPKPHWRQELHDWSRISNFLNSNCAQVVFTKRNNMNNFNLLPSESLLVNIFMQWQHETDVLEYYFQLHTPVSFFVLSHSWQLNFSNWYFSILLIILNKTVATIPYLN